MTKQSKENKQNTGDSKNCVPESPIVHRYTRYIESLKTNWSYIDSNKVPKNSNYVQKQTEKKN